MKAGWGEIISAHRRASQFSAFLRGVDVFLPTGESARLQIERVRPLQDAKLFQIFPHTFVTEMNAGSFKEFGCAEAAHPLLAIQKSISEAVERCLFRALKGSRFGTSTSNGWAAHFSRKKAERSALLELLERDAALIHALREIPFLEIQRDSLPAWLLAWERRELGHTIFPRLRVLVSTAGHFPTVSTAFVGRDGFGVVSHGTGTNLERALIRALAEACHLARIALSGRYHENSRHLFSESDGAPPMGPCEQAVAYAHHAPLPSWMFGEPIPLSEARKRWSGHVARFHENPISYEFVPVLESPIVAGYCKSADVQGLFFGRTHDAERRGELNRNRLGKPEERISVLPHFVA